MKKQIFNFAVIAIISLFTSINLSFSGNIPESKDPIRVVINDWTGQYVSTKIAGELLKKMGYNVEYVTAGALPQLPAFAQGTLDIQTEIWTNNVSDAYHNGIASGDIILVGELGLSPREGWIYPPYMEEKCPGLPSYKALYECAMAFGRADTFPKGRLITYPADWGTRSKDIVAAIGMPFEAIAGGSEGAMIAELKSAYAKKEPILMMFWRPHWIFAELDFNWVEWNPVDGECVEETQSKEDACGFQQAKVVKITSKVFKDKYPGANKFFEAYQLNNDIENLAMLEIDTKGRDLMEVVNEWIDNNQSTWQPWIDAGMN
tara:strand:+ start:139 stop:1092 length:954 start_codon:yes stop_codon:yes gene_type:complete